MRKVISLLFAITFIVTSSITVSAQSIEKNEEILRGKALLEVPEDGIDSLESIKQKDVQFIVEDLSVNGLNLHLKGEISYNDQVYSINKKGKIKGSTQNKGDLNIEFKEKKDSNQEISLVNALVKYDVAEENLLVNKSLENNSIIQLIFLNNITNDLIIVEDKISDINGKALQQVNKDTMEKADFDVWGHKVFKAAKVEQRDVTALYQKEEDGLISIMSTNVSDYVYRDLIASYRIVGGTETHVTTVRASITGSSGWSGTQPFFTELEVYSMRYTDKNGKSHSGASVVQAGHYSNPVKWYAEINKGSSSNRDILQKIGWDKSAISKSSGNLSLSFGIGWGPLSYSYTPSSFSQTVTEASSTQIYSGGSRYPGDASVSFSNTYLHRSGQFYNGTLWVTHNGSNTTKNAKSVYTIPYYNNDTLEYLGTATLTTDVNYISK